MNVRHVASAFSIGEKGLAWAAGSLIIVMIVLVCLDIVTRFLSRPVHGVIEAVQLIMVVTIFLGLSYCQKQRRHIRIMLLSERLPAGSRRVLDIVTSVLALASLLALAAYSGKQALWAFYIKDVTMGGLVEFPLWPSKVAVSFGVSILCMRMFVQIIQSIRKPKAGATFESI